MVRSLGIREGKYTRTRMIECIDKLGENGRFIILNGEPLYRRRFLFLVLLGRPCPATAISTICRSRLGYFGCGSHSKQRGRAFPPRLDLVVAISPSRDFGIMLLGVFKYLNYYQPLPLILAIELIPASALPPPLTRNHLAVGELIVLNGNLIDGLLHSLLPYRPR